LAGDGDWVLNGASLVREHGSLAAVLAIRTIYQFVCAGVRRINLDE